jgi:thiosulfate dehydrogenase [quinone] large subunit
MKNPVALLTDPAKVESPRVLTWLTHSRIAGLAWSAMRIWLGVMWIQAGVAKLWGAENPAFMHHNGAGVAGFAAHGVASYSWWASFLHAFVVPNAGWIGILVSVVEFLAGIGLVLGLLTPVAAGGALILNLTYMLSGTAGVNPFYALFAVVILATWRTSGLIGVDGLLGGYLQRHKGEHKVLGRHHHVAGIVQHPRAA